MTLLNKILIFVGAALLIGVFGFTIFKLNEISNRLTASEALNVEQKALIDGIVRSQSQYATRADVESFVKENGVNLKAIKDDLENLRAELSSVNVVIAGSKGQVGGNIPSTGTGGSDPSHIDPKNPDPFGHVSTQQKLALNENFGSSLVPIGTVGFSAWQKDPWNVDILQREYKLVNVIGVDENQRNYVYNKFTIKTADKEYTIPITKSETKQEFPAAKFSFWNPRLGMSAGGSVNLTQAPIHGSANAGIVLSIMSYGKFKNSPDIQAFQLGAGYQTGTQKLSAIINPINFNIGHMVGTSLINNTYIGPSLQVDTGGNVFTGINVGIGF